VPYDENGVAGRIVVTWASNPVMVAWASPFVAALEAGGALEIQLYSSFATKKLSQILRVNYESIKLCEAVLDDGSLLLVDTVSGDVVHVPLASLAKTAEQILESSDFEDALSLCRIIPEDRARRALEDRIHLEFGRHLLREGRYEEGLVHLGMTTLSSPLEVLKHFNFLIPRRLLKEAGGTSSGSDAGEIGAPPQDMQKTVSTLTPYLLSFRSRLLDDDELTSEMKKKRTEGEQRCQRSMNILLDTALLNALLIMPDSGALLQFLQRPNCVDMETGTMLLEKEGRYAELVALLKVRGRGTSWVFRLKTFFHGLLLLR